MAILDQQLLNGAVLPSERGVHNVLLAACGAVGFDIHDAGANVRKPAAARELMGLPTASQVCIVFVDGLGFHQLDACRGHVPAIRGLGEWRHITTIAPSTTASALSSFSTGQLPGSTGMVGYSVRVGVRRTLTNLITFKNSPIPAQEWQPQPTIFELLGERARETVLVEDPAYQNSGLTLAAWRGAPAVFAKKLPQRVDLAVRELQTGRKIVYLYWGNLDRRGHKYGVNSPKWLAELELLDAEVGRLAREAPRGTLIVLTSDHGMVEDSEKLDIAHEAELDRDVSSVAGEERAFHIYTPDPDSVAQRWQRVLEDRAWVLTRDQVEAIGLFGSLGERARSVIGDVIAFARGNTGFVDSRVLSQSALALRGVHGSLTELEMHIPWIAELV
ncbi:MAG: alkaline phosphatase family protein [Arcanobacterium sp.]|nr:alkaline phosphatase family protein [Arcanobacterium sp.]MDY5588414.1 alkaline phosphatase family protein [Arcanobacterium sp.]